MRLKVFIQNEAGSNQKNVHDEKTLEWKRVAPVSRPYPYPYGFVLGTSSPDGCNVDCYVITRRPLRTGQIVDCLAIGLMEQIEDGQEDHNVLAGLEGEGELVTTAVEERLTAFVLHVFDHVEGKRMHAGQFLGPDRAAVHVQQHSDEDSEGRPVG